MPLVVGVVLVLPVLSHESPAMTKPMSVPKRLRREPGNLLSQRPDSSGSRNTPNLPKCGSDLCLPRGLLVPHILSNLLFILSGGKKVPYVS